MKTAILYRMVMPSHVCPFGIKSLYLLKRHGFNVEDNHLKSREETEAFKIEQQVETTPQVFIDGKRVGGYDELRGYFGVNISRMSYAPLLAIFGVAALMALALNGVDDWQAFGVVFVGIAVCLLAVQKLRDLEAYTTLLLNYDLLAIRFVPYAYIYAFIELIAGLGTLHGTMPFWVALVVTASGLEGVISIFKAVYLDKRKLKCACMGGGSRVPLGLISILENGVMAAMGIMVLRQFLF